MKILSHRGYWHTEAEKNTETAFIRAFKLGFGLETDVRDLNGRLVVSHDPPVGEPLTVERLFELYKLHGDGLTLALNIKADGLQHLLLKSIAQFDIQNYFVFDMSVPDTLAYLGHDLRVFTRISEYETSPAFLRTAIGIWLDCFESEWLTQTTLDSYLESGKKVCLVSPELHKRDHQAFWSNLRNWTLHEHKNLMICTDFPEQARSFFNDSN